MGRKSLAQERRNQILAAFVGCILEKGLDGATTTAIATAAGVERTLVHHYFGSRAALEQALIAWLMEIYQRDRDAIVDQLPDENRVCALLDYLFSPRFGNPELGVLFDELFSAANRSEDMRGKLLRLYREFEDVIAAETEKAFPAAPAPLRQQVVHAVMCLAEMSARFTRLGFPESRRRANRVTADAFVAMLERASPA